MPRRSDVLDQFKMELELALIMAIKWLLVVVLNVIGLFLLLWALPGLLKWFLWPLA
jgi:hypothetical protein